MLFLHFYCDIFRLLRFKMRSEELGGSTQKNLVCLKCLDFLTVVYMNRTVRKGALGVKTNYNDHSMERQHLWSMEAVGISEVQLIKSA